MLLRRGDIVLTDFNPAMSGEAGSIRPAILLTNNIANDLSPVVVVIPLTSNLSRVYPNETVLPNNRTGLDFDSKAQVQLIRHVSQERIKKVIGHVPEDLMNEVDTKLREHLAL